MMGLAVVTGCSASRGSGSDTQSVAEAPQRGPAPAGGSGSAGNAQSDKAAGGGQPAVPAQERHVIRTATLRMRVDDVTAASAGAREVAERFGGFVASEHTDPDAASLTLRVAADRLDEALTALDEFGDVTSREQQAEDVTEQVVDVDTRIANQRASVERVRALLGQATTIGEIMQIESELTTRQADLESLENRAAALAGETQLATVTVALQGKGSAALADERTGFLAGLEAGWNAFLTTLAVLLTVFGVLLPFLLALGVPLLVVLLLLRQRRLAAKAAASSTNG